MSEQPAEPLEGELHDPGAGPEDPEEQAQPVDETGGEG
jgi:hypothetical protein